MSLNKFEQPNTVKTHRMKKSEAKVIDQLAQLLELPPHVVRDIVEIMEASTSADLKRCHEKAPEEGIRRALAERKWDRLVEESARAAETAEEFAVILAEAREGSEGYFLAFEGLYHRICTSHRPFTQGIKIPTRG